VDWVSFCAPGGFEGFVVRLGKEQATGVIVAEDRALLRRQVRSLDYKRAVVCWHIVSV